MIFRYKPRVIAVDPTSRGYAFAVLEGPDRLVDWGTTQVPKLKRSEYLKRIAALFERYQPKAIILESPRGKGSRRSPRVARLIRDLELLAWRYHAKVFRVSRGAVKVAFAPGWRKHEIARAIGADSRSWKAQLLRPVEPGKQRKSG